MPETLNISAEELKRLTTGRVVERPKYTFFALDKAVEYSGANAKPVLGDVGEIYEAFEEKYPEGDFGDWKTYYLEQYQGDERLAEATDVAYEKLLVIREAIKQIDKEDVREFIEGFALYGTYENRNIAESIVKKLISEISGCEMLDNSQDVPETADLRYGEYYLAVRPEAERGKTDYPETIRPIFFEQVSNGVSVDVSQLNLSLDKF